MRKASLIIALIFGIIGNISIYSNQDIFDGKIKLSSIFYHDDQNNYLYILDNELKLTKVDLETGLSTTNQTSLTNKKTPYEFNSFTLENQEARMDNVEGRASVYEKTLKNIINDFSLINVNDKILLIHNGGGVVMKIEKNIISRLDDSFAIMHKFMGDLFVREGQVHHFGGYGLWRTNNIMLKFYDGENQSKQWEEVISNNDFPNGLNKGISNFASSIYDKENYYILGGQNTYNGQNNYNNNLYNYNFNSDKWTNLGEINYPFSNEDIVLNSKNLFYIFNRRGVYILDVKESNFSKFNYSNDFSFNILSKIQNENFISHYHNETTDSDGIIKFDKTKLYTVRAHNSRYGISNLHHYDMDQVIDVNSKEYIPLFTNQRDRNDFFIPILIVVIVIMTNLMYQGLIKGKIPKVKELYDFEDDELRFLNTPIELDNNSLEILKMLLYNERTTSNDVVAKLVENGLSYDYASKVKNKIIDSLNEKFKFITNSDIPFISVNKSSQDKRIQILEIIKYNKKEN